LFVIDPLQKLALQNHRFVPVAQDDEKPPASPAPPDSAVSDPQENTFWTTPGDRRTLQFKNELLVDEDVDLGNVTPSFSSPVVPFNFTASRFAPIVDAPLREEEGTTECPEHEDSIDLEDTFDRTTKAPDSNVELDGQPATTSEPSTPIMNSDRIAPSSTSSRVSQTHSAKKIRVTSDVERITVCGNETCLHSFVSDLPIGKNMGYCG
jgi:hypothetical protein